ncbi:Stromalin conservative (SCD) domain profile [Nakaseomyces glabratus]
MSNIRRSARLQSRTADEDGYDSDENTAKYIESDESVTSESDSGEDEDQDDDDYMEGKKARQSRGVKRSRRAQSSTTATKRTRVKSSSKSRNTKNNSELRADQERYLEIMKEFKPTELYEILSTDPDIAVEDVLREYMETYKENRDEFLQTFINLLLNCCGAVTQVEKHDIRNNESSADTITEVQLAFQRQKIHEFHLVLSKDFKKKAKYPALYQNIEEFMSKFLEIADDMQLLYTEVPFGDDDSGEFTPLVTDLFTWISAFSVSKIRCFRYIATFILYCFEDYLTNYTVELERDYLSRLTKQLSMEQKKKRQNKSTITKISNSIEELTSKKRQTDILIDNISKIAFIHRFKDVDDSIRKMSVEHLTTWIINNPEKFLKVSYLKYYGWLMSDDSSVVRSQVLRSLPLIISGHNGHVTDNAAIRQFYERFKDILLEIAMKDIDMEVRLLAVQVLAEVSSLGYLEIQEIVMISSLIFDDKDVKISSHSKNSRFLAAVARFLSNVCKENVKNMLQSLESSDNVGGIPVKSLINIGYFMRLLSTALSYYLNQKHETNPSQKVHILFQAAEFLFPYFGSHISNICKLLIIDEGSSELAAIKNLNETFNQNSIDSYDNAKNTSTQLLVLPDNRNNIILYITVLNGLCHGGYESKVANKAVVYESVIPHIASLLSVLPVQSIDILGPILRIIEIFQYEEWINVGLEKDLIKIVEKIGKLLNELTLSTSPNDLTYNSFACAINKLSEFQISAIDNVWRNAITSIKFELKKFLDQHMPLSKKLDSKNFTELTRSLYENYINKLTLLGKNYPVEIENDLVEKIMNQFISRISNYSDLINKEFNEIVSFKLLTVIVTWHIHTWSALLRDEQGNDLRTTISERTVNTIAHVISALNDVIVSVPTEYANKSDLRDLIYFKWIASNSLIDIILAINMFVLNIPDSKTSWKLTFNKHLPKYLADNANKAFLEVFLLLEGLYADEFDLRLERMDDEDVNFNDLSDIELFQNNEKELLLFTIKLKALMKLDLLSSKVVSRISLNKDIIGPLFMKVIDNSIFETSDAPVIVPQHASRNLNPSNEQIVDRHNSLEEDNNNNTFPEMIEQSSEL